MSGKRSFGAIEKLKLGRYRARYRVDGRWINAPTTFATKAEAGIFLDSVRTDLVRGAWKAPRAARMTVEEYGQKWRQQRQGLKATTRAEYESCWRNHIGPYLGSQRRSQGPQAARAQQGERPGWLGDGVAGIPAPARGLRDCC